ncbi:hypothetical protein JCM16106_13010 [Hydrogenophilus islandicus]
MELILPGALWPNPNAHTFAPLDHHPTLARWLGRSTLQPIAQSYQEILVARLGAPLLPVAQLRWRGEMGPQASSPQTAAPSLPLLCADPVHLMLARDRLVVTELGETAPTLAEAEALARAVTEIVREEWPSAALSVVTPTRWYLTGIPEAALRDTHFVPLAEASSRPFAEVTPYGGEARAWLRRMNEWQVALTHHPVNRAREARGLPTVNALWLWGESPLPAPPTPAPGEKRPSERPTVLISDPSDPMLRGWLMSLEIPWSATEAWPDDHPTPPTLLILDALAEPARRLDLAQWQEALARLERHWFARLATPVRQITLAAARASVAATPRWWRRWAKARPLDALEV